MISGENALFIPAAFAAVIAGFGIFWAYRARQLDREIEAHRSSKATRHAAE